MAAKKKGKRSTKQPARLVMYVEPKASNRSLVELVRRLALRDGAEVLALTVLHQPPWYARIGKDAPKQIAQELEREAAEALESAIAPIVEAGVSVRSEVAWGRPFAVVIEEVLRRPARLVLLTADGDGRNESGLFGSMAMNLFRKCPAPVWAVKPGRAKRIRRVLAAVDPVDPTEREADLNLEILRQASEIALQEEAELHVCHVYPVMGGHLLRSRMTAEPYRAYLRALVGHIEKAMAELISQFGLELDDRRVHLLQGEAGQLIPELAAKLKVDLLVMGTIARAGIPGLLIGNTAERMLRSANCSVLALKPTAFVSPLEDER